MAGHGHTMVARCVLADNARGMDAVASGGRYHSWCWKSADRIA